MTSMQLTLRLAGLPVDRDRHGGNIKIDGDTINHFDFGMTDLELPTESQKTSFRQSVGSGFERFTLEKVSFQRTC